MSADADSYEWPAFHEASHCCLAEYFSQETKEAWIARREGQHIPAEWRAPSNVADKQRRLNEIIVLMAGRAGVDRLSGRKLEYPDWHESDDYTLALRRAMWLSGDDEQAADLLLQWGARRAELLVERLWHEIHAVAYGLLEHERLTGSHVREIIKQSNNGKVAA